MSKIFTKPHLPIYPGGEPHDFTKQNGDHGLALGIYTTEDVQRYVYGTRLIMWDGRVYKYCNALAEVKTYWGAVAWEDAPVGWTAVPTQGVLPVGSRKAVVTIAIRTIDDLAGAYLMTFDTSATQAYLHGIVGNSVTATRTTMYLDAPMPITTTTNDKHEVFLNPYAGTKWWGAGSCSVICVPAHGSQAGYKYWGQTYGPAYISPTNLTLDDPIVGERLVYFHGAGQVGGINEFADAYLNGAEQIAGFILNPDVALGTGIPGPLIMLQISI